MFLDHLKTRGNNIIMAAMIEIKAVFKEQLKMTNDTIKAATPIATFNP